MNTRKIYNQIEYVKTLVRENFKFIGILTIAYIAAAETGFIDYPELPDGSMVVVTGVVAAGIVGFIAATQIEKLFPEPPGIYLFEFESADDTGGKLWNLSEDQFAAMEIKEGNLFEWPHTAERVYEVRKYDADENVAYCNWRESVAGSQLAGSGDVVEAYAAIDELRTEFEPEARKYRILKRRLRKIARKLDRRRLRDQEALLDEHTTPAFESDDATVTNVIRDELPDELLPKSMKPDEWEASAENGAAEPEAIVEFEVDEEALPPAPMSMND